MSSEGSGSVVIPFKVVDRRPKSKETMFIIQYSEVAETRNISNS